MKLSLVGLAARAGIVAAALVSFIAQAEAQSFELERRKEPVRWSSGRFDGRGRATQVMAERTFSIERAPWIQLEFSGGSFGRGSHIEITSLFDGARQVLDAKSFDEWGGHSAYFNGDAVSIRLFVAPGDVGAFIEVAAVVAGEQAAQGTESLCGADDRVASTDGRVGRIDPIGCTGWITENGRLLTAGHCLAQSGNNTLSINPPASSTGGTVNFPPPDRQYAIDSASFQFSNNGMGDDWGIFAVFNNSVTGLQPVAAQGGFRLRQDLNPANLRVTGFGTDNGTANQTNQTHVGPNAASSGTTMRYTADTQPGNSGSPIIDEASGEAVGIHTHGGCSATGGNNHGTSFFNAALWAALDPRPFVGVIPHTAGCPAGTAEVRFAMDNEDHNQASSVSGWVGATSLSGAGNITYVFCRVLADQFRSLHTGSSARANYAVLRLSDTCPAGSVPFSRSFDNEDNNNANSSSGPIHPNVMNRNTTLNFCLFRGGASPLTALPQLGFDYGVFAGSTFGFSPVGGRGTIFSDDEDDNNANSYSADPAWSSNAQAIVSAGGNTTLRTGRRGTPFCGDGVCNALETASTCNDCAPPPPPPPPPPNPCMDPAANLTSHVIICPIE